MTRGFRSEKAEKLWDDARAYAGACGFSEKLYRRAARAQLVDLDVVRELETRWARRERMMHFAWERAREIDLSERTAHRQRGDR